MPSREDRTVYVMIMSGSRGLLVWCLEMKNVICLFVQDWQHLHSLKVTHRPAKRNLSRHGKQDSIQYQILDCVIKQAAWHLLLNIYVKLFKAKKRALDKNQVVATGKRISKRRFVNWLKDDLTSINPSDVTLLLIFNPASHFKLMPDQNPNQMKSGRLTKHHIQNKYSSVLDLNKNTIHLQSWDILFSTLAVMIEIYICYITVYRKDYVQWEHTWLKKLQQTLLDTAENPTDVKIREKKDGGNVGHRKANRQTSLSLLYWSETSFLLSPNWD